MYRLAEQDCLKYTLRYDSSDPINDHQCEYQPDYYQLQNLLNVEFPVSVLKCRDCCHTCRVEGHECDNHDSSSHRVQCVSLIISSNQPYIHHIHVDDPKFIKNKLIGMIYW